MVELLPKNPHNRGKSHQHIQHILLCYQLSCQLRRKTFVDARQVKPSRERRVQRRLHKKRVIRALLQACVKGTQNVNCLVSLIRHRELSIYFQSVTRIHPIHSCIVSAPWPKSPEAVTGQTETPLPAVFTVADRRQCLVTANFGCGFCDLVVNRFPSPLAIRVKGLQ